MSTEFDKNIIEGDNFNGVGFNKSKNRHVAKQDDFELRK